jgi:catechol 2,3-dioxygenase-like lactoylglutathione lyase family enzyme
VQLMHAAQPDIDCEMLHPALAVSDVRAAAEFYTARLGFKLGFLIGDPPTGCAPHLHARCPLMMSTV